MDTYLPLFSFCLSNALAGHHPSALLFGPAHKVNLPTDRCYGISFLTSKLTIRIAAREGLIANGTSVHAGLRSKRRRHVLHDHINERSSTTAIMTNGLDLSTLKQMVTLFAVTGLIAIEIDVIGVRGIIERIIKIVGTTNPVYLSVDIDVIDPGLCPGTGTPESGGWTTRELRAILRGLQPLRIVGGDLVEVSPPYDVAESTALAAADLMFEMLSIMVKNPGFEGPIVDVALPRRRIVDEL